MIFGFRTTHGRLGVVYADNELQAVTKVEQSMKCKPKDVTMIPPEDAMKQAGIDLFTVK